MVFQFGGEKYVSIGFSIFTLAIVSVGKKPRIKYATGNSGAGKRNNSRYGVLYGRIVPTLLDQRVKTVRDTGKHIKLYTRPLLRP